MPAPRSRRRARLAALVSAALAVTGSQLLLAPPAAQANPGGTDLVITEVYVNGGSASATYTNKYVEIFNPTGSPIALDGKSVQYRAPGSSGNSTTTVALTAGNLAGGDYWLLTGGSNGANGIAVPNVDQTSGINPGAGGGTITLINGTSAVDPSSSPVCDPIPVAGCVIDKIGWGTSNTPETSAAAIGSVTTGPQRVPAGTDSDNNLNDFASVPLTPGNPKGFTPPAALALDAISTQNSAVGTPIAPLHPNATGGTTPYAWSATGLPDGLGINSTSGVVSGTPTTDCACNVQVTVEDSASPTHATANRSFAWNVTTLASVPIKDIQGTGASSPIVNQLVKTEGVVTAAYPTGGFNGFYVQTPGADTPDASDAIFVYGGPSGFATYPSIGDSVDVTGTVAENFDQTEIKDASWAAHGSSLGSVTPKRVIPGTDCAVGSCQTLAQLDAAREVAEGEAFQPAASNKWTLTDVYDGAPYYSAGTNSSSMFGEEGAAAESDKPLVAPTEVYDTQTQATQLADLKAWNDAHRIVIDDGSSLNYTTAANTSKPFPWMTPTYVPRVGAAVTFPAPAILISDFSQWRLLPSSQVVGEPTATQPQFAQTRAANAAPASVGGDLELATFNVLNFFPTDGNEYEAADPGNHCTYFTDRAGAQVTTNACGNPSTSSGNGPRGAANQTNVTRQRDKIVAAINIADADIVSLEELENSAKFGKSRDFAITQLVDALNTASTPGKWAFAPSPTGSDLPALADEDVIRTGFIYQPARVSLVGPSKILVGSAAFANAREPLAQAFKKVGTQDSQAFAVIVNHFKSKGSGADDGTGQGLANPDRIAQANALVTFANDFKAARGISKVFLAGDFNAYSEEDPIQVLEGAGYAAIDSTTDPDEETYNFDGQVGSLDHVFANAAALPDVTGADVWAINGYESVYYEYSRFNYNATNLYDNGPFRSSDHSPEIVGIHVPNVKATPTVSVANVTVEYGLAATVTVHVAASGASPTGTVTVKDGATTLGTGAVSGGTATITLPATSFPVGTATLTASYSGDSNVDAGGTTFTVTVTKASSTTTAKVEPGHPKAHHKVKLRVTVAGANGVLATGQVTIKVDGTTITGTLKHGKLTGKIAGLAKGDYKAKVVYLGDANVEGSKTKVKFTVS